MADVKASLQSIEKLEREGSEDDTGAGSATDQARMTSQKSGDVTVENVSGKKEQEDLLGWIKAQHRRAKAEQQGTKGGVDEVSQEWFRFARKYTKEKSFDPQLLMQINDMQEYLLGSNKQDQANFEAADQ